jgi:hypothetical protein
MDSIKDWKSRAGVAVLTLLGILLALYGMAPVPKPPLSLPGASSAPGLDLEQAPEGEPPSNEVGNFLQLG